MINLIRLLVMYCVVCAVGLPVALASYYELSSDADTVLGQVQWAQVAPGDTFVGIARRYDVGFYALAAANPGVDPDHLLLGTALLVPTEFVMPDVPHHGIVVNTGTMRLYYFPDAKHVYVYPIGIGKKGWVTPVGHWRVIEKKKNPVWFVPTDVWAYRQERGDPVPHVVGAGPDNPLGHYAMRLSNPTYLIHGTNEPESVGRRSSAGCIHLYPEDIYELFAFTSIGTPVTIINQPYLVGHKGQQVYVEAHLPLEEDREVWQSRDINQVFALDPDQKIDQKIAKKIIKTHLGVPILLR